jgi:phosphoglucosamine mutase
VDGDATLWIIAKHLLSEGKLADRKVVATVMSNIGLEMALESVGAHLVRVNVGDKYVLEALLETGAEVGGEQSGHIIIPEVGLVGDGLMTMIYVLRAMTLAGSSLAELASGFVRYPQVLLNVSVAEKRPFEHVERIAREKAAVEAELRGNGRLLLRYSGTENLARVMIEGIDQATIERQAQRLGDVIRHELGSEAN